MVVMALDHVRDFFTVARFRPLDLSVTTPAYFATRWVTHVAAPVFVFLAGTSAYLSMQRGKSRKDLARFLATRGIWLVILELTVVRLAWTYDVANPAFFAGVIWAIGWSMLALAALVLVLPSRAVGAFGVALVATHNLADGVPATAFGDLSWLWIVLHDPGVVPLGGPFTLVVEYPLLAWIGVMAAGYGFGEVVTMPPERRDRTLVALGLGMVAAFALLRASNVYGDPRPWAPQESGLFTLLSFLNVEKYPPSLLFLLVTLGPALAALPLLDRWRGEAADVLVTLGRVPLFYYVAHLAWIHALTLPFAIAAGYDPRLLLAGPLYGKPPGWGFTLPILYLIWAGVVLTLWPLCRWFADVKRTRKDWWLSYL